MAITEKLIVQEAAAGVDADPNIMLDLNAGDVDSYDGDGDVWYDIHDFEFKPTTNVSEHFNTVLYTGDGNTTAQPITQVGFTPDLVWIKTRNQGVRHILTDSVRGVDSQIFSNEDSSESNYGEFNTFDSDGFTVKRNTGTDYLNQSGINYVAWCFKAGGAASLNEEGTIDSQVSVNNDLGFSIVKYSGGNSSGTTVGHGLSSAPELIITKNTSKSSSWPVFLTGGIAMNSSTFTLEGSSQYLALNSTTNFIGYSFDSQFGGTANSGSSSQDIISYCFTSKRGVSKVGSYTGTGASGNKIYTGFEPAFLMFKGIDQASDWIILDNKRDTSNPNSARLDANSNGAEYTGENLVDFNRDGFTLVTNSASKNGNGNEFIYYAVAKDTNETSLIPSTDLELYLDASTYTSGSTWTDSSGNGNNGTITGATHNDELGGFFQFDGTDDKVEIPDIINSHSTTITGWVRGSGIWFTPQKEIYALLRTSSTDTFFWGNSDTGQNVGGLEDGNWHHLAVSVTSSNTVSYYVDGEHISTKVSSTSFPQNYNYSSNWIGHFYHPSTPQSFNGQIGQVMIYGIGLTQDQIRQNFNFTKPKYPNEFHGDINGATWNSGGYFDFDGSNDNVDITGNPLGANNFTYSAWFNADTVSVANQNIITSNAGHVNYGIQLTGSGVAMYSLNSSGGAQYLVSNTGLVSTGTWYHIAYVKSSISGHFLYLNGTVVASDSSFTGDCDLGTLSETTIGSANNNIQWFNGKISKVKLYNKALTQEEIDALYNEGE